MNLFAFNYLKIAIKHKMQKNILHFFLLILPCFSILHAQTDSLLLKNGNVIVGEAKEMNKGVLIMKTVYSDSDFKIEWNGIKEIYTESNYLITISDGSRYNGKLQSSDLGKVNIIEKDGTVEVNFINVVYLKSVKTDFWSRAYASIDFGYSFTKANNLNQVSIRSSLGYLAEKWSADVSYNTIGSTQENADVIRRTDGGLTYKLVLPRGWYLFSQLSFLSNTEQKLDLRTNMKLGVGKYLIQTNKFYWGLQGGASLNDERFSTEDSNRQSLEAFLGTELNLFDIGDFNLLTKANAYPSLTDSGRWRADIVLDLKYNLPLDFYTKLGLTYNYDNRAVEGGSEADYVFQFTFGWEL